MTAIKPPGTDLPTAPTSVGPSTGETNAAENAGFAQELNQAQQLAGQAPVSSAADPIAQISSDLQAGKLSMEQALDALVERALGGIGHQLGAQERADLAEVLRTALGSDPTLAALRDAAR